MKVLNFGSLNLDHVYRVEHIAAPGETIASESLQIGLGGKGLNQSLALACAGAEVYHAGCVGSDGDRLVRRMRETGVHTEFVRTLDMPNGHAIIQVECSGQNNIIIFGGANRAIPREMVDEVLDAFEEAPLVLMQNETSEVFRMARECAARGLPLAFNPSPYTQELEEFPFDAVTYLFVNETEGQQITHKSTAEEIVDELLRRYPRMKIILTLGGDGACYADCDRRIYQKAFPVKAVDTTGAGDTFTGYFLGAITRGESEQTALREACAAAAVSVTNRGAADGIPSMQTVREFLNAREEC